MTYSDVQRRFAPIEIKLTTDPVLLSEQTARFWRAVVWLPKLPTHLPGGPLPAGLSFDTSKVPGRLMWPRAIPRYRDQFSKYKREGSEKALPLWTLVFASRGTLKNPHPTPRATTNLFDAFGSSPDVKKPGDMECA